MDELSRLRERVASLEIELDELRVAWCMTVCDAPSPDDESRPLHTSECRKARATLLAPHPALPPSESGPAASEPCAEGATPSPRRTR